jgi:hypothetical protein
MADKKIRVSWEVEDGYVGKSRPQHTDIPLSEFEDDMTAEEMEQTIDTAIQEDFEDRIAWGGHYSLSDVIAEVRRLRSE